MRREHLIRFIYCIDLEQYHAVLDLNDGSRMFPILDSLNQLAATPWRINTKMLDVAIKVSFIPVYSFIQVLIEDIFLILILS